MDIACGVLEDDVREDGCVGFGGEVGAEAYADVERAFEGEFEGWAQLVHRFALKADVEGDFVSVLLDADAFGVDVVESASEAERHVLHLLAGFGTPGEVDHAGAVLAGHGFLGVVIERLADDEDDFAIAVAFGVGEGEAGGEGEVAGDFFPEIAELVAGVPDVIPGGGDGVGFAGGVEGGGAGDYGGADVGLALEEADGLGEGAGGAVEAGGWRDLGVGGGAGLAQSGTVWAERGWVRAARRIARSAML